MNIQEIVISCRSNQLTQDEIRCKVQDALLSDECSATDMSSALGSFLLHNYVDVDLFSKCIDKLTVDQSYNKAIRSIEIMARYLKDDVGADEMNMFIVSLVVDANGFKRDVGRRLWDDLNLNNSDIDLLQLSEEFQARFALSILQDYNNPEYRLPKLMTLFSSEYESVRKMVLHALTNPTSNYVMNYYGTVKKFYEKTKVKDNEESKQLQQFLDLLKDRFELAYSCKELYPDYAMPEVFDYCNRNIQEHLKSQAKEAEKNRDDIISRLCRKAVLGKGGGSRNRNGSVTPLAHISFQMELPSMINSLSGAELIKLTENKFLDWNTIGKKHEE